MVLSDTEIPRDTIVHFHPLSSAVLARFRTQITLILRIAVGTSDRCCLFAISIHAALCSSPLKTGAKAGRVAISISACHG